MKIIILAAGKGSRLGDPNLPKTLTLLNNGKSILEYQLENICQHISLDSVHIVVGFQKELIIEKFSSLSFIINPHFAHENTSKSLLRALNALSGLDDDVLWINGDVVFHPSIFLKICNQKKSSMIVNTSPVGEEEVKYRTDDHYHILEVSKTVLKPEGEALGINLFKADDLSVLKENLNKCDPHDYFEQAIQWCIDQGVIVQAIPIPDSLCAEVDFPQDLDKVNQMIQQWKTIDKLP